MCCLINKLFLYIVVIEKSSFNLKTSITRQNALSSIIVIRHYLNGFILSGPVKLSIKAIYRIVYIKPFACGIYRHICMNYGMFETVQYR